MACFAVDQGLSVSDLESLSAAVVGDKRALRDVCRRFCVPILVLAFRASRDLETAVACVEPTLRRLCAELLSRRLEPQDWPLMLEAHVREFCAFRSSSEEASPSLEGITVVARVVRRRMIRRMLPELPLAQLMALLLRHLDSASLESMVGLVAETTAQVQGILRDAYDCLQSAGDQPSEPASDPEVRP